MELSLSNQVKAQRRLNCCLFPCFSGDKALDGYSKKKYVCKLLFIFLLGHDIDFGHMEAVNLLSSNRYTEKQIVSNLGFIKDKLVCLISCLTMESVKNFASFPLPWLKALFRL